jgi:hypothetical protein
MRVTKAVRVRTMLDSVRCTMFMTLTVTTSRATGSTPGARRRWRRHRWARAARSPPCEWGTPASGPAAPEARSSSPSTCHRRPLRPPSGAPIRPAEGVSGRAQARSTDRWTVAHTIPPRQAARRRGAGERVALASGAVLRVSWRAGWRRGLAARGGGGARELVGSGKGEEERRAGLGI